MFNDSVVCVTGKVHIVQSVDIACCTNIQMYNT